MRCFPCCVGKVATNIQTVSTTGAMGIGTKTGMGVATAALSNDLSNWRSHLRHRRQPLRGLHPRQLLPPPLQACPLKLPQHPPHQPPRLCRPAAASLCRLRLAAA